MIVHSKILKWGNGLALRLAGVVREIPHFKEGMAVDILVSEEGLTIKKSEVQKKKCFPFTEAQLLKGLSPKLAHADLLAKPLKKEME